MPVPPGEIDPQILREITRLWTGSGDDLKSATPLLGGYINTTLKLTTRGGDQAVLKITPDRLDPSFEVEAYQLDQLRSHGFPTPAVFLQRTGTPSFLLMEFVPGIDLEKAASQFPLEQFNHLQSELGEMVARLHQITASSYGEIQFNRRLPFSAWDAFFREIFEPIWQAADQCGLMSGQQQTVARKVRARLESLVKNGDGPRLVHWDLWAGNVLISPDGSGIAAIIDPACRFAHAEAELAFIELFQTANESFFYAYRRVHPLCDGYETIRKHVYQLYFLLNHLRLFGEPYLERTAQTLQRLAPLV